MKLMQFLKNGMPALGIVTERGVIDAAGTDPFAPTSMAALCRVGEDALPLLEEIAKNEKAAVVDPKRLVYAPVITYMEKILCIGLNYRAHAAEVKKEEPVCPAVFSKFPNTLAAHNQIVKIPAGARKIDYEAELAVIVGRNKKPMAYTVGNDLSIREWQNESPTWTVGKNADGFGPLGPVAVTADSIDADDLAIEMRRNGEVVQSSRTSDMIFSVEKLLEYLDARIPLKPGDVIFTGTPSGVIIGQPYEQRVWLKPGDVLEASIEGIGTLRTQLG